METQFGAKTPKEKQKRRQDKEEAAQCGGSDSIQQGMIADSSEVDVCVCAVVSCLYILNGCRCFYKKRE